MTRIINLGGGCEPPYAIKLRTKELSVHYPGIHKDYLVGPFDWLGIPTYKLPEILDSNWYENVFSLDNIFTFRPHNEFIGVRDLKYHVNSIHHFKPDGSLNYFDLIGQQLPKFRQEIRNRWHQMRQILLDKTQTTYVVYRDYYPYYFPSLANKNEVRAKAAEAIVEFAPYSQVVFVCESPLVLDKVSVVEQLAMEREFYDVPGWIETWQSVAKKMFNGNLEAGAIYTKAGESKSSKKIF